MIYRIFQLAFDDWLVEAYLNYSEENQEQNPRTLGTLQKLY